jgi:hypothetical protein
MAKEGEGIGIPFTDIHINLTQQTITLKKKMQLNQSQNSALSYRPDGGISFK